MPEGVGAAATAANEARRGAACLHCSTPLVKPSPYPATQGKPPAPLAAPYNTDGEGIGNPQRDGEEIHRRRESADAGNPGNSSGTSI